MRAQSVVLVWRVLGAVAFAVGSEGAATRIVVVPVGAVAFADVLKQDGLLAEDEPCRPLDVFAKQGHLPARKKRRCAHAVRRDSGLSGIKVRVASICEIGAAS